MIFPSNRVRIMVATKPIDFRKPPLREAVIDVLEQKPRILECKKITERIIEKLLGLVATFDDGLGGV